MCYTFVVSMCAINFCLRFKIRDKNVGNIYFTFSMPAYVDSDWPIKAKIEIINDRNGK